MRSHILLIAAGTLLPSALFVQGNKEITRPPVFKPVFNARNFPQPTKIDNRYFPLVPGTIFIYEAIQGPREHDEFVVTQDTKEVLGVDCVVVRDKASVNGEE